tara:strand:- start:5591 stop:6775 length:1185 start_codon:yes stop_codon:yes gene_type:complete
MANRIYFANQQVAFRANGDAGANAWAAAHGVQSVAVTTTFNLEQAFELGQLSIYENIEGVPDVEVTMTKVLDGYPLLYTLATKNNALGSPGPDNIPLTSPTLAGRSNEKCIVAIGIWPDTSDQASGTSYVQQMEMSGMFVSSIGYNFPLEDNFTEDITLVGNDKAWADVDNPGDAIGCDNPTWALKMATGQFNGSDAPIGTGEINRRENLAFASSGEVIDSDAGVNFCRFPTEIPGVSSSGWMSPRDSANTAHLSSVTVSTDLGREELFELGTRQPYARVVTFPIEVTCDIEMISLSGDMVNAFADGCGGNDPCTGIVDNLTNQIIRVATCEGTRIYLGEKNKLSSVNYGGGDAGGGNVSVTYSYTNFNDCTVMHPRDPSTGIVWEDRKDYLQA